MNTEMRTVYMSDENRREKFAITAAKWFKENPNHWTYTDNDIACGELFAMRFGGNNDGVIVFKISDRFEPINYAELIRTHGDPK